MLDTFYLSSFFPQYYFYKLYFELPDRWITGVINTNTGTNKWGKIGPSHLLNENGDLSFLLYFSKQCLVENIQGKFQKNSSVSFICEESP